jgi:hypothetical protein
MVREPRSVSGSSLISVRTTGFFGICGHDDAVEFRRIWIRRLPPQ